MKSTTAGAAFACPRSCPFYETVDSCRFMRILQHIGPTRVNSHTARVAVEFSDVAALTAAVESMGGKIIGNASHRLFERAETGFGFTLPNWRFPLVAADGQLAYDDYGGRWGNTADLQTLQDKYVSSLAAAHAAALGWQSELTAAGLLIHHPDGGSLLVNGSNVDASGFIGSACHTAAAALGLKYGDVANKPEFGQVVAEIRQQAR